MRSGLSKQNKNATRGKEVVPQRAARLNIVKRFKQAVQKSATKAKKARRQQAPAEQTFPEKRFGHGSTCVDDTCATAGDKIMKNKEKTSSYIMQEK